MKNTNGSMDKVHVRVVIKFLRLAITVLLRVLRRKIHYLHMEDMCMMIVVRLRILLFGWQWDSEGNAVIDETIDCNPAKGTLMVRSTGEPVNLFFSYGKAVMTEHGSAAEDTGIDEIGIGYLGGGRLLYNTAHRYGAFYWSGSGDSHADTNMLFIDFWYSLNTNVPINVGTLNTNNGMFVRCVRSEK